MGDNEALPPGYEWTPCADVGCPDAVMGPHDHAGQQTVQFVVTNPEIIIDGWRDDARKAEVAELRQRRRREEDGNWRDWVTDEELDRLHDGDGIDSPSTLASVRNLIDAYHRVVESREVDRALLDEADLLESLLTLAASIASAPERADQIRALADKLTPFTLGAES